LVPRWGDAFLDDIKAVKVEAWLSSLPYAPATKAKFRNQMSCLYSHAVPNELWDKLNPIATVRQSSKRQTIPDILTLDEMTKLLGRLTQPIHRIAVLIAAVTGLRRSEIRGLEWKDVDFEKRWLRLERGVVRNDLTKLKTEGSRKGVPIPDDLCEALAHWRKDCQYPGDNNWVIASPTAMGEVPLWLDIVLRNHIKPAAASVGITKRIGWHTFRRSLASILAAKGENVKVVQELLRHSNSAITLELYQQAEADAKRAAQNHVNGLFVVPKAS
jgi:integrase